MFFNLQQTRHFLQHRKFLEPSSVFVDGEAAVVVISLGVAHDYFVEVVCQILPFFVYFQGRTVYLVTVFVTCASGLFENWSLYYLHRSAFFLQQQLLGIAVENNLDYSLVFLRVVGSSGVQFFGNFLVGSGSDESVG